jgi:prepilin-type N-terminal cleavage/methylation domain-containing protein
MAYDGTPSSPADNAPRRGRTKNGGRRWCVSIAVRKHTLEHRPSLLSGGFTLIEVTLVLVILVVIGAIITPQLTGAYNRSQLRNGAEVIRSAWLRTRLRAMETGQTHVFRCALKGGEFQLLSIPELMASGGQAANPTGIVAEATGNWWLDFTRLPAGVLFAKLDAAPSQQVAAMFTGLQGSATWAGPVVFYPDGTCTDATVLIINENENTIRVTLRGMTGTVNLGEVGKEAI